MNDQVNTYVVTLWLQMSASNAEGRKKRDKSKKDVIIRYNTGEQKRNMSRDTDKEGEDKEEYSSEQNRTHKECHFTVDAIGHPIFKYIPETPAARIERLEQDREQAVYIKGVQT